MDGKVIKISLLLLAMAFICSMAAAEEGRLKIATTTSLYDTKLLDVLEEQFEEENNATVDTVSGGTGIAIQYGERGDVDLLLVHDKVREVKFVEEGHGLERRCFAYNYFYLIGPEDDPAGVEGKDPAEAFKALMDAGLKDPEKVMFISRGDNSGTHAREKLIWNAAGLDYAQVNNSGPWYIEAGQGMGATLNMANEKQAYTLCDASTFMAYQGNVDLVPLIEGGDELLNVYVAMTIDPATHPGVNCELANKFIDYLVSDAGQDIIASYGEEQYGKPLFFAARGNCELIGCSAVECAVPTTAACSA
jgi:tungstate transport system substrate-binding protein